MKNPVLTPHEAISHIKSRSDFQANLRQRALQILNWVNEWNQVQPPENQVLCFLREGVNVAFCLDRDNNREKKKRPNFLVIKARNDYLDFGLGERPGDQYRTAFEPLKDHKTRWILHRQQFPSVDDDLLKRAFLEAMERQLSMTTKERSRSTTSRKSKPLGETYLEAQRTVAVAKYGEDPLTDREAAKQFARRAREIFLEHNVVYPWVEIVEGAHVLRSDGGYRRIAAVESNTSRGFHKIDKAGPGALEVYRDYFVSNRDQLYQALTEVESRQALHAWSEQISGEIRERLTNIKQEMLSPYNKVRKLVDLHLQALVSMSIELADHRLRLVPYLFLPLDSQIISYPTLFTEADLRSVGLNRRATYKDVGSRATYVALQERVAERAVEMSQLTDSTFYPIFFDLLWNRRDTNWGRNLFETVPERSRGKSLM
ncbi:MAG: hypothetical protein H6963_01320 [Chromatiaceae bacterium]|nr:hypothetical protein [Gammaproteobacteria bacterium]MCP5407921.1 hypothetical protein [Chromatiaceae bacterium]